MNNTLSFVTSATDPEVLNRYLLASPCLASGVYDLSIHLRADTAAEAFNREIKRQYQTKWLVWVHQDVMLPQGWDSRFIAAIADAERCFSHLAVVGVYGVSGAGGGAQRAGHVLDRGTLLKESAQLPCLVDSIDELLFAVRTDSGLCLDPDLGFDFYGTDVVLQAKEKGFQASVVDACCEHWSATPREGDFSPHLLARVARSGAAFERKWASRLPVTTPCFDISCLGDVAAQCHSFAMAAPHEPAMV